MRLLLLSSEFPPGPGGVGTHAFHVVEQLRRRGWEVSVISPQDYASREEVAAFNRAQPFTVMRARPVPFPPLEGLYRWRLASRWINKWKPDVLMASGQRAVWLAAALAGRYGIPWAAVGHGTEFGTNISWERRLSRWSYGRAGVVVCVSEYTRRQMLTMGIRPREVCVIPNGADAGFYRKLPREQAETCRVSLGLERARLLLTVGNVTERKGQEVVIRALPHVLKTAPDTHYLIAGLPTMKEEFSRTARALRVEGHVHFLGRVEQAELLRLFNCSDIFVMTSQHTASGDFEGYGIAVVEAALCGKPAVVSADSGLSEAIVEGVTGFAVTQGDERAVADSIVKLLTDETRLRRMSDAAYERAVTGQTWENRAQEYDSVLKSQLRQRGVLDDGLGELASGVRG
jgi:phosphatidylinositol alpha-1,6-mannosyltransferase